MVVLLALALTAVVAGGPELPAPDPRGYAMLQAPQTLAVDGDRIYLVRLEDCRTNQEGSVSDQICVYGPLDPTHLRENRLPLPLLPDAPLIGSVPVDTSTGFPTTLLAGTVPNPAGVGRALAVLTVDAVVATIAIFGGSDVEKFELAHGCAAGFGTVQGEGAIDATGAAVWLVCSGRVLRIDYPAGEVTALDIEADGIVARPEGGVLAVTAHGATSIASSGTTEGTSTFATVDPPATLSGVAGHGEGGVAILTEVDCGTGCSLEPDVPPEVRTVDRDHHVFRLRWDGTLDESFEGAYVGSSHRRAEPPRLAVDAAGRVLIVMPDRLGDEFAIETSQPVVLFDAGGELPVDGFGPRWGGEYAEALVFAWDGLVLANSIDGQSDVGRWAVDPFGSFMDDDRNVFAPEIEALAGAGITAGCHPSGLLFCPDAAVTRGQMAALLARWLGLPAGAPDAFTDDAGSPHEPAINAIAAAGITTGCDAADARRFCPAAPVSRAQMASLLARALTLDPAPVDVFEDDAGSPHEPAINAIAAAGITVGCDAADATRFCPGDPVRRGQMAGFLHRAGLTPAPG